LKNNPFSDVRINDEGKDFTRLKHAWTAQWITHPTASTLDYGVFHFRRSFQLGRQPEKFIVYVSADNRYRLFVNGRQVCFGPALGDIAHYRYETLDIAEYLQPGKNVIAAEVVNFGEFRRGAQQTFMTAFILQCDKKNAVIFNTGEPSWKVIKNEAYQEIPFTSESLRGYYAAGPGDYLDGSRYPWGWQNLDFNDENWQTPRLATVEFAVGRGFLFGSTWFLVPRKIPFMEETEQRFQRVVRWAGADISEQFVDGNHPFIVPPDTKASLLMDHGVHTVGFPELLFSGGKGSKIKITYAEALVINSAYTDEFVNANLLDEDVKGNRNVTDGKKIFGVYDVVLPGGGKNRLFRPLWMRTFRYVQIDVETGENALTIHDFKHAFSAYPFRERAAFASDDPALSKIWEVAWRTTRNGAGEIFQDSPYYEQLQYIGDTRLESLVTIYVSGDDRLMRKAIEHFDDSRIPEGLTQSRYPSYIMQIIPTYSLFWIAMIHDYYMYRNDPEFLRRFLPGIRGVLEWFERHLDDTGMPANLEWWNFTDWAREFQNGIPPGADDGHSASIALQYVYALHRAAALFEHFDWTHEADKFARIAESVKKAAYESCYDDVRGMFAETPQKKVFSQHTNTIAILTDAISEDAQKQLMRKILNEKDLVQATLYFKFYLFRALQKTGMGDEYLGQLAPWKRMLDMGLTTFAETEHNPRSDCHAWSATPCFDLLHLVAGIYPAEPGFKKVIIAPNFGHLKQINAEMPHPAGQIRVALTKSESGAVRGTITLPENLTGSFLWNGNGVDLKPGVQTI